MKIVITAGGTSERIDDVRTITNSSTGSLGFAIGTAFAAEEKIETIYYLHGKRAVWPDDEKVVPIEIGGVMDLEDNLTKVLTENKIDAVIHAMAVSDYMVHQVTTLVGFKLLSGVPHEELIDVGYRLLQKNKCDFVMANDLREIGNGMHKGYLIHTDKTYDSMNTNEEIAAMIVRRILETKGE